MIQLFSSFMRLPLSGSAHDLFRRSRVFQRVFLCSIPLVALMLLAGTPHFAHARGGTWQGFTYNGPTGSRPYFVYTPANYVTGTPIPLLVMLHGCMQSAADFAAGTQMDQLADTQQFLVVYPQQPTLDNGTTCWNWFVPANQTRNSGEPAIIAGIVQTVEQDTAHWTIASNRVYVAGISAGAVMSVILGATYPDLFAAIGVVAGSEYPGGASSTNGLDPQRQGKLAYQAMGSYARVVPTIVFQGSADSIVAPVNGDLAVQQWMQTDTLASHGSYHGSFANPSQTIQKHSPQSHPYTLRQWNDDNGQEVQEYWLIDGAGHAWTGGSLSGTFTDPQGPNISQTMYSFFQNHPL